MAHRGGNEFRTYLIEIYTIFRQLPLVLPGEVPG